MNEVRFPNFWRKDARSFYKKELKILLVMFFLRTVHAYNERIGYAAGQSVEPFTRTKTLIQAAWHGRKKDV